MKFTLDNPSKKALKLGFKTSILTILSAMLLTSCVYYQRLPDNWARPVSASGDTCPNISGKYNDTGEEANGVERKLSMLFDQEANRVPGLENKLLYLTSHISLQQQDQDSLHIVAWRDKKILYSKTLSRKAGDFKCENGWLTISSSFLPINPQAILNIWRTTSLARADEYLLVENEDKAAGTVIFFPMVVSERVWMRFPVIKDTGARDLQSKKINLTDKEIRSPQFSPDGEEIVFTLYSKTSSRIYKISVDGKILTLLSKPGDYDADPAYSPNGKTIIFTSFESEEKMNGNLCLMKSDGSGKVCLTTGPEHDFNPIFSPNGSKVYFVRRLHVVKKSPITWHEWHNDLYSVNVDGTGLNRITQEQFSSLGNLSIHPDGRKLLAQIRFTSTGPSHSMWIIPLENPDKLEPVEPILDEYKSRFSLFINPSAYYDEMFNPLFSPDGISLLFTWQWKKGSQKSYEDVFVMDLKTRRIRKITSLKSWICGDPSFSHDGSKIVFSTIEHGGMFSKNTTKLWIVNTDGTNMHTVDF